MLNIRIVVALRQVHHRRRKLKGATVTVRRESTMTGDRRPQPRKKSAPSSDGGSSVTTDARSALARSNSLRHSVRGTPAQKAEFRRLQEERRLVLLLIGIVRDLFSCRFTVEQWLQSYD